MPCSRQELENRERQILAPYAQFSADSHGRKQAEPDPEWRTQFQRDRDRVIHSRAFRRLEYKTQVFLNGTGDHFRTRLTHTMEVAGISRNIARALRVNEDLTETISLAHDLGHSPFGHTGEEVLNRLMSPYGGFEHNQQSLRVVEHIEQKYPSFPGLNLTWETLEGLHKHAAKHSSLAESARADSKSASLEAQIANLADEVAYYSHDLDDGLDANLLSEKELFRHSQIWHDAAVSVLQSCGDLPDECRHSFIIRCIIDCQVRDIVLHSESKILDAGVQSAQEVRQQQEPLVQYSPSRARSNLELREYLYQNLYYNENVHGPNVQAVRLLEDLFQFFLTHPDAIGEQAKRRAAQDGWPRAICDYLAGMTDRYVLLEHERWIVKGRS